MLTRISQNKKTSTSVPFKKHCNKETQVPFGKQRASKLSLGIYAKYSANFQREIKTGHKVVNQEINNVTGEQQSYDPMVAKLQRFALQSVARKFLPKSRTANCLRLRQAFKQVQVWHSIEYKTAAFAGLQTCGSVWACPICAAKIAERRRVELIAAMATHKAAGGSVNLLTLTAPHQRTDNLRELLERQARALKYLFKDRSVKKVFGEMGLVGQIRALEVTHGRLRDFNNGWHPHYHILLFGDLGVDLTRFRGMQLEEWRGRLYERWSSCCVRAGLGAPTFEHGLRLDEGSKASRYVSKWGLEDEMTKGHTKKAMNGETPFDFLRAYLDDPKDKQAAALFKEFADAFKGKRQLHWSAGLKKRYGIGKMSDEELALKIDDHASILGIITLDQWRDVLAMEGRGLVLILAANGGWDAVERYLGSVKGRGKEVGEEKILTRSG
jgi:hypothetical protein